MTRPPDTTAEGAALRARELIDAVDAQPTVARIAGAARELTQLGSPPASVKLRLAVAASFTFEPMAAALRLAGLRAGFDSDLYVAPYGQFDQALIDPVSGLNAFEPDAVILAVRLPDVCPAVYESFTALVPEEARRMIGDWHERLQGALAAFRKRSRAYVLIQNYEQPAAPALGIADRGATPSQRALIDDANDALATMAGGFENVRVMDYDGLTARHGRAAWADRRLMLYGRIPVAPAHYWAYAGFLVRHLRPLYGLSKKVLVLDADNTLWGGVIGDVGLEGIALGPDYPGNAFVQFQRRVLDLHRRGVVLCLASKNEPGIVEEALARHPEMVLRPEHFAAMRVNWDPKPDNILSMAEELNLGLDSFVFVDDNPTECALVRAALPQVMAVALPREPARYAAIIESLDFFDQWAISEEDRRRGALYRAEAGRRRLQTTTVDLPTFYRRLEMKLAFGVDQPAQIARAAQMTNRTNQFNMHTVRCTEDDIRRFMQAPDQRVVTLALADRFGDSGVVGLAVVRIEERRWVLHLFLMSCRVLGRTVEQAFITWIARTARNEGAARLDAEFVPTAKNKPFAGFYESVGFRRERTDDGMQIWTLPLDDADIKMPDWFEIAVQGAQEHG